MRNKSFKFYVVLVSVCCAAGLAMFYLERWIGTIGAG